MSSNYPPGVTGREPAIAGAVDIEFQGLCQADAIDVLPWQQVLTGLTALRAGLEHPLQRRSQIRGAVVTETRQEQIQRALGTVIAMQAVLEETVRTANTDCGYDGPVEGQVRHGEIAWTCPRCGSENTQPLDTQGGD